jgi:FkbM family methyltransferase
VKRLVPRSVKRLVPRSVKDFFGPLTTRLKGIGYDAVFVEVGAHHLSDEVKRLALRRRWRGLLIEALPQNFEKLKSNYSAVERFVCINSAVSDQSGEMPFYFIADESIEALGLPWWLDQTGSFDRAQVARCFPAHISAHIRSVLVPVDTLSNILIKNNIAKLDVLLIDAEGYDYRILSQLDFNRWLPRILIFEHNNLMDEDLAKAESLLKGKGYALSRLGNDTVAELKVAS